MKKEIKDYQSTKRALSEELAAVWLANLNKYWTEIFSTLQDGLYIKRKRDLLELREKSRLKGEG
jgi:hypothetical protein